MALPRGAMGLSVIVVLQDHTHLLFFMECDGDLQAESPSGSYVGVVGWEGRDRGM